jgi:predicted dehydrogenase
MPGVVKPTLFRGDVAANGGGQLVDSGAHPICEAMWVSGQTMTEIRAVTDALPGDGRAQLAFTLSGGGYGSIATYADSERAGRLQLGLWQGSRAVALVRAAPAFEVMWMPTDGEQALLREIDLPRAPQPVAAFVEAVLGRAAPRSPGRDCVRYVAAVEAAYRSAAEGRRVELA